MFAIYAFVALVAVALLFLVIPNEYLAIGGAILAAICGIGFSYLVCAGIFWLVCWAFSWTFSWKVAFGIWLVLIVLTSIFKTNVTIKK